MKRTVFFLYAIAIQSLGAPVSKETAVGRATDWMAGNPVMQVAATRAVASVETFPDEGGYSVYVVHLSPAGYLVLNSDDRLPLMVSFSAESTVDLSDIPQNTFRAMLLQHVERMEEQLSQPMVTQTQSVNEEEPAAETELFGPYLETTWNQCNPYNLLCPDDPGGSAYYDYRVPVGCTPTAFAQILAYHRWPLYGNGSHTYTDNSGATIGSHSVDFSDVYDWSSMLPSYNAWNPNPPAAEAAVAELMYELGVAAEANYENGGTSSSVETLGGRLGEFLYFESCESHANQTSLIAPMEADLRAGFPCVVAIPGHAIVADGLMVDNGATTYHINYGWGGSNNGWWDANGIPGGALQYGTTALRPRLMAFPQASTVTGSVDAVTELGWIIPKRRTNEVAQLEILRLEQQTGSWQTDASEITGINVGWSVVSAGRSGDCWFTGPNDYSAHLLGEVFVPDASSQLAFWQCARLFVSRFSVEVSTDDGASYDTLYTTPNDIYESQWTYHTLPLAAYAGQQIRLRFALSESGGYYHGDWAGIRLDDLEITGGDWHAWEPFAVDTTLAVRDPGNVTDPALDGQPVYYSSLTGLPAGTHTLAAALTDTLSAVHGLSPAFTLTVTDNDSDGDGMPADWETLYGFSLNADDSALDPDFDGYGNLEEYICGTDPTNAASCWMLEPGLGNLPGFLAKEGRLYTILYRTDIKSPTWTPLATDIAGSNQTVNVRDYDSATNAARYYCVEVRLSN